MLKADLHAWFLALAAAMLAASCAAGDVGPSGMVPPSIGDASVLPGSGGTGGAGPGGQTGGATGIGSGGAAGIGSGGTSAVDASGGLGFDAGAPADGRAEGVPAIDYMGQIPIQGGFVGPEVTMDCPADPALGWTEYNDTFKVQRPYDLMVAERFKIENGIYTFWVFPTDKAHEPGNTTEPRTEARWSNFANDRPHMWSADMLIDSPSNHVTVMQVHTTASGAGPVYLRVDNGNMHRLNGPNFATGLYNKWFNMKVAFNPMTLDSTVYINNCPKATAKGPRGDGVNYFKNGTYTCTSTICRAHFKNIHLYRKE